jgi:hypothetical protein
VWSEIALGCGYLDQETFGELGHHYDGVLGKACTHDREAGFMADSMRNWYRSVGERARPVEVFSPILPYSDTGFATE